MHNMSEKKQQNKFIILPVFLGVVCLLSAGVVAGVNSFTEPAINARIEKETNEGYLVSLGLEKNLNVKLNQTKGAELPSKLQEAGIKVKTEVVDESNVSRGIVFDGETKGYGGFIKFQIGFADGKFKKFNLIGGHSETPSLGGVLLSKINERLEDKPADSDVLALVNGADNLTAGKTMTSSPLIKALTAAADNYLYPDQKEPIVYIKEALNIEGDAVTSDVEVNYALHLAGVNAKKEVKVNNAAVGFVYDVTVIGEVGPINFIVGLANSKFAGYTTVRHSEPENGGARLLATINDKLKNKDANSDVLTLLNAGDNLANTYKNTSTPIVSALEVIADDHLGNAKVDSLENFYKVLEIDATEVVKKLPRNWYLDQARVVAKYQLKSGIKTDGYVYYAELTINAKVVKVLVGYKADTFSGFIVNNDEANAVAVALNAAFKGEATKTTNVTTKVNGTSLTAAEKEALIALLTQTTEDYNNRPDEDPYVLYYPVLGVETAETKDPKPLSDILVAGGVVAKVEMKNGATSLGYVYEVSVSGFSGSKYTFLVGFNAGKFTGFATIGDHGQTPGYGGTILDSLNNTLKGKDASSDLMALIANTNPGSTQTRTPLIAALTLVADDYLAEVN